MNKATLTIAFLSIFIQTFAGGIPKNMPDDFGIYYDSYLGAHPTYLKITISIDQSDFMLNPDLSNKKEIVSFTVNHEELSTLYSALRSMNAFTLKSKQIKSAERGGEYIKYMIAGKEYVVNNSGHHFIIKQHVPHFDESIDLITAFADRHRH